VDLNTVFFTDKRLTEAVKRLADKMAIDGYNLVAHHCYTDISGRPLYYKLRFKHPETGEKRLRPLSLHGDRWQQKEPAWPNSTSRPLYRLDELSRREGERVVVVEGELKVDALLQQGVLATTSGGAQSARNADWSPLAGRAVLIWPDNDDAGSGYARAVCRALGHKAHSMAVLNVDALNLPPKGDVVDWLPQHPTANADTIWALPKQESEVESAAPVLQHPHLPVDYLLDAEGLWALGRGAEDEDQHATRTWLSAPLKVIAKSRSTHQQDWGRLIEWVDDDGVVHQRSVPMGLLESDPTTVRAELASRGLHMASAQRAKALLVDYIKFVPTEDRVRCVEAPGWLGDQYCTPAGSLGQGSERSVLMADTAAATDWSQAGSEKSWRAHVASRAPGNSRLVFGISAAFAGPLLELTGVESGGFHLRGGSAIGKSTILKAAASIWGHPRRRVQPWRATANGLEGVALAHNDATLILDELGQCDPLQAGEAAYMLANGSGKLRGSRHGGSRPVAQWRTLVLSSGEVNLSDLLVQAQRQAKAGQVLRMGDIDADAGAGHGAFEQLHGLPDARTLALALDEACQENHGATGWAWLEYLVSRRSELRAQLAQRLPITERAIHTGLLDPQPGRVLRRFALVAAAGELATEAGLTGWEAGEATRSARGCFESWWQAHRRAPVLDGKAINDRLAAWLKTDGPSRIECWDIKLRRGISQPVGYYRGGRDQYCIEPTALLAALRLDVTPVVPEKALREAGALIVATDGRPTHNVRPPGASQNTRMYVIPGTLCSWAPGRT
jgi:uncharacterized protein (DUF927 family)